MRLLVVLQAMDAAGKDGTIRHVMSGVNPQGVEVHSFKVPSAEDLDHDYLWRYAKPAGSRAHRHLQPLPLRGDARGARAPAVLAAQKLPPSARKGDVWKRRFREVNDWEHYLTDQGYRIVKIFLNLSKEEQRRRFLSRIDEPEKNWKFSAEDARERASGRTTRRPSARCLSNTSTEWAPWYVIPADDKPLARVAAAGVIANALIEIDPQYPTVSKEAREALQAAKVELEAEAPADAERGRATESAPRGERAATSRQEKSGRRKERAARKDRRRPGHAPRAEPRRRHVRGRRARPGTP